MTCNAYPNLYQKKWKYYIFIFCKEEVKSTHTLSHFAHKYYHSNMSDYVVKQFAPHFWSQESKEGFIQLL